MNCNANTKADLVNFFYRVGWRMDCCKVLVVVFYAVAAIALPNRQIPVQTISLISQIFQIKIMDQSLMILVSERHSFSYIYIFLFFSYLLLFVSLYHFFSLFSGGFFCFYTLFFFHIYLFYLKKNLVAFIDNIRVFIGFLLRYNWY